ncbi:MAG TPA: Hpt domain-containing protein [Pirellula sp.]|nr:Hpt domain-containing protein [Pirellula sp.]
MPPIDLSNALKATDGDLQLLQEVLEAFLDEYPTLLAQLEAALLAGNNVVVQRASHTIKGTLRLFGNVPSQAIAEILEQKGVSGSLENARESFESLKLSLATLRLQLLEAMKNFGLNPAG